MIEFSGGTPVAASAVTVGDTQFFLATLDDGGETALVVRGPADGFAGERMGEDLICPLTTANAQALQARLPWLVPVPLGKALSFGFGDRLHLRRFVDCLSGPFHGLRNLRLHDRPDHRRIPRLELGDRPVQLRPAELLPASGPALHGRLQRSLPDQRQRRSLLAVHVHGL